MAQASHPSSRVVSVRMPGSIIERLDALAERTGRSRGLYIKMAVTAMLPELEREHWNQVAAKFEDDIIERKFYEIMQNSLRDIEDEHRDGETFL
ncbi:ribbon-helix-helix domain-containing protein [Corynebacterium lubricantis]|uniref:ribbon-helix-helix domain-containing protein n=1 Tax=Corynebacterium lubricantis TaxID=541095 RepID=UPI0005258BEA|nr:ribbon-helix-helix domain-containing protein [Corynebacterium lubricantis]